MNKKGFSLVELMIVVVIMGILVAVAIPLFGAVTENAEANTCGANQRLIRGAFANWAIGDSKNTAFNVFNDGYTEYDSRTDTDTEVFEQEFLERFDDGRLPGCSVDGCYYIIKPTDSTTLVIECYNEDGTLNTQHESKE